MAVRERSRVNVWETRAETVVRWRMLTKTKGKYRADGRNEDGIERAGPIDLAGSRVCCRSRDIHYNIEGQFREFLDRGPEVSKLTHRPCFCISVKRPFKARIATVPPRSAQSTSQSINRRGSVM